MGWVVLCVVIAAGSPAQEPRQHETPQIPQVKPVPPMPKPGPYVAPKPPPEPTDPPAQIVADSRTHVSFHLPAGWVLSRKDGEISTFHLDARTAPRQSSLRAVANLNFNPFPLSTFSGAIFYLSATSHISASACAAPDDDQAG